MFKKPAFRLREWANQSASCSRLRCFSSSPIPSRRSFADSIEACKFFAFRRPPFCFLVSSKSVARPTLSFWCLPNGLPGQPWVSALNNQTLERLKGWISVRESVLLVSNFPSYGGTGFSHTMDSPNINQWSHEENPYYFPLYWWVNRDPGSL